MKNEASCNECHEYTDPDSIESDDQAHDVAAGGSVGAGARKCDILEHMKAVGDEGKGADRIT